MESHNPDTESPQLVSTDCEDAMFSQLLHAAPFNGDLSAVISRSKETAREILAALRSVKVNTGRVSLELLNLLVHHDLATLYGPLSTP